MIVLLNGNKITKKKNGIVTGGSFAKKVSTHVVNSPVFGLTLPGKIAPPAKTFLVGASVNSIKFNAKKRSNIKFIK